MQSNHPTSSEEENILSIRPRTTKEQLQGAPLTLDGSLNTERGANTISLEQQTMKRTLGHLDKRKRRTRCRACAERRIKCDGGYPCEYCVRTKQLCQGQVALHTEVQFVTVTNPGRSCRLPELPMQVCKHQDILYLDHFALFMQRCQFTRGFASVITDLLPLFEASASLRSAAIAIGALDASRRSSVCSLRKQNSTNLVALRSYGRSIQILRGMLAKTDPVQYEVVLWCTFLLGLFELMAESSGDSWARHLCYGTSKILQMAGPTKSSSSLRHTVFDAFRVSEATRAIIYGDETFLSQDTWLSYHPVSGFEKGGSLDPMETIYTLMIEASSFAKVLFDRVGSIPEPLRFNDPNIVALARRGVQIQQSLRSWYHGNASYLECTDCYARLALANYHALELFHNKNFTFHSHWVNEEIPRLDGNQINAHITAILDLSEQVLKTSILPVVTLLFPLRVAGANTFSARQGEKIIDILGQIYRSGFIVADRIKVDVQELWEFSGGINSLIQQ